MTIALVAPRDIRERKILRLILEIGDTRVRYIVKIFEILANIRHQP